MGAKCSLGGLAFPARRRQVTAFVRIADLALGHRRTFITFRITLHTSWYHVMFSSVVLSF